MTEPAGEQWAITFRAERHPVPPDVRIANWLKRGKRDFGLICTLLDVPAELRALEMQLALANEEIAHLKGLVQSLADRCARQAQVIEARARKEAS